MVDVGLGGTDGNSVLHVPDLGLVIAGDVIYNGVHIYLGQSAVVGFGPWREAIAKVEALGPRHIVCGHQDKRLDDDAKRTIEKTGSTWTMRTRSCAPRTPLSATSTPR